MRVAAALAPALAAAILAACSLVVDTTGLSGGSRPAGDASPGLDASLVDDASPDGPSDASLTDGPTSDAPSGETVTLAGSWTAGLDVSVPSGPARLLLVTAHIEDDDSNGVGATVTSMTIGTTALARVPVVGRVVTTMGTTQNLVEAWILREADLAAVAGATGTSLKIVPQLSRTPTETPWYAHVVLKGVHQATTFGDTATVSLTNGTGTISLGPVAAPSGSLIVSAVDAWNDTPFTVSGATMGVQGSGTSHAGACAYAAGSGAATTTVFTHASAQLAAGVAFVVLPNR